MDDSGCENKHTTTTGRDTLAADHDGEEITPYTQYAENYNE